MKHFEYLFTAWIMVWAVFFAYGVSVARRVSRLREEVARLREQLRER